MTLETIFGEFFQISLRPKNHWSISVSNSKSIPFRPCGSPLSSRQSSRQESSPRSSCQLLPPPLPLPLLPLLVALPGNGSKHVAEIETTRPYHTCCGVQNLLLPPDWDRIGQMVIICDKDNLINLVNDDPLSDKQSQDLPGLPSPNHLFARVWREGLRAVRLHGGVRLYTSMVCNKILSISSGRWFQPSEKYESDWIIIPTIGENKKCSKPPNSHVALLHFGKNHAFEPMLIPASN